MFSLVHLYLISNVFFRTLGKWSPIDSSHKPTLKPQICLCRLEWGREQILPTGFNLGGQPGIGSDCRSSPMAWPRDQLRTTRTSGRQVADPQHFAAKTAPQAARSAQLWNTSGRPQSRHFSLTRGPNSKGGFLIKVNWTSENIQCFP